MLHQIQFKLNLIASEPLTVAFHLLGGPNYTESPVIPMFHDEHEFWVQSVPFLHKQRINHFLVPPLEVQSFYNGKHHHSHNDQVWNTQLSVFN